MTAMEKSAQVERIVALMLEAYSMPEIEPVYALQRSDGKWDAGTPQISPNWKYTGERKQTGYVWRNRRDGSTFGVPADSEAELRGRWDGLQMCRAKEMRQAIRKCGAKRLTEMESFWRNEVAIVARRRELGLA